ncbi:zinc finger protein RFP-like isoform X1 [Anolis sagrei]|uniref:zinc finger protein RFP-like isoform X1 n=1 Tax=Anolis sagrei TaxID=38937 RepID=UPI003520F7AD
MAVGGHPSARLQEDATCSICLDFFQDPVMIIDCGHNYCRACISQCQGQGSRCPRCRIPFPSENLRPNRDLRNLVEAIQQLSLQPLEKTTRPKPAGGGPKVCEKHQEAAKLFCREDQAFLCLVCRESRAHRAHTALPIEEAAQEYRDQIQTFLKKLAKERDEMQRVNLSNKHNYQQMKSNLESAKQRIGSNYPKKEAQTLMPLLNTCEANLKILSEAPNDLSCLNKLISEIEKKSQQSSFGFLQGIGDLLNRCERETRRPRHDLRAIIGSLHEKLCVVNTKLNQCAENTPKKPWIKENVTLDAKTAHPRFFVSDDRKSVHWAKTRQDLPYSSKRFEFARCVLGKKGFTSGKHYWIVDVEDGDNWAVGVAQESVDRGGKLDFEPDEGIWAMARYDDQYKALTSPPTLLDLDYDPVEIQVSLNYDAGIVHFYDEDKKPLFTFRSFDFEDEKVFPFFRIGNSSTSLYLL